MNACAKNLLKHLKYPSYPSLLAILLLLSPHFYIKDNLPLSRGLKRTLNLTHRNNICLAIVEIRYSGKFRRCDSRFGFPKKVIYQHFLEKRVKLGFLKLKYCLILRKRWQIFLFKRLSLLSHCRDKERSGILNTSSTLSNTLREVNLDTRLGNISKMRFLHKCIDRLAEIAECDGYYRCDRCIYRIFQNFSKH